MIIPNKIFRTMKLKTPTIIASKGRMVETPRRSKNESTNTTKDPARQAHTECTPIGIFAKARFRTCTISVASTLSKVKSVV